MTLYLSPNANFSFEELGDADKVKYVPTSGQTRITALQSGEIDLLARNTTFNFTRDTSLGLMWAGINFYDGQAFIAKKRPNLTSAKQLDKATMCIDAGTSTERNLQDFARNNSLTFKTVVFDNAEASKQAFISGRCHAYTGDYTALAILRATDLPNPADFDLLPEIISKEPVGNSCDQTGGRVGALSSGKSYSGRASTDARRSLVRPST